MANVYSRTSLANETPFSLAAEKWKTVERPARARPGHRSEAKNPKSQ
jgi:hypothetical protein